MSDGWVSPITGQYIERKGILVRLWARVGEEIKSTEWYQDEPQNFDLVKNYNEVMEKCGDDIICQMDSFNWTVMNKTEITASIYKFITNRAHVIRRGFDNEVVNFKEIDWVEHIDEIF